MKKKYIISLLIIFIFCYFLFTAVEIWNFGNVDEKQHCDVVVVLGASTNDDGVSPVYRERIDHGIWLINNGFADYIILTGGLGKDNKFSDAYIAREYTISKSIPSEKIFIEEDSKITEENLENSKRIIDKNGFESSIIVSDPLHMKRAMLMAKDYGFRAYPSPTPTSKYVTLKTKIPFLLREEFFYIGYKIYRIFNF